MKKPAFEQDLADDAVEALQKAFGLPLQCSAQYKKVAIFGAGEIGRIVYRLGRRQGIPFVGFLDDYCKNPDLFGLPAYPLAEGLPALNPDAIILATLTSANRMRTTLQKYNCTVPVFWITDQQDYLASMEGKVTTDNAVINQYRDIHRNRRAFIVCNGPSLLKTDPRRLKDDIVFACNNVYLLENFAPTYYVAEDRVLTQDRAKEINALPWVKFIPNILSGWLTNGIFIKSLPSKWPEHFSTDLTKWIEINFTVTYCMMQVAFFMGCDPVYLIGCDHNYVVDDAQCHVKGNVLTSVREDPNHFHPQYFGPGYRWHHPRVERMEAAYTVAKRVFEAHGRTIYNATSGGKLEVFARVDFSALI